MLSSLLRHADDDPQSRPAALSRRPRVRLAIAAALPDPRRSYTATPDRPAIVVAGDDRQARELATSLRAWLAPRRVRYYPSRGVTYESHLAPPAHLTGQRIAALDALLDTDTAGTQASGANGAPVVVVSAVALSEKVPDPSLRPHGFTLRRGELLDLDETAIELVAAGYERVDQVEDRGQFAIRGGLLDVFPSTEDRAVRVDLFGDEIDTLRWVLGPSLSAHSVTPRRLRSPRPPSSRSSTASSPRSPRQRAWRTALTSPSCSRSRTSRPSLS